VSFVITVQSDDLGLGVTVLNSKPLLCKTKKNVNLFRHFEVKPLKTGTARKLLKDNNEITVRSICIMQILCKC